MSGANGSEGGNGNGRNHNGGLRRLLNGALDSSWKEVRPEIRVDGVVITHVKESHGLQVYTASGREFRVGHDLIVPGSENLNRLRRLVGRGRREVAR